MPLPTSLRPIAAALVAGSLFAGCATVPAAPAPAPPPESEVFRIPIVVTPKDTEIIPEGSRIVIADIAGPCADEVKTALMKRLVDNADYDVITRDNLRQIIGEADMSWAGKFNTETAAKLGELMGASLWIVGRVAHCGQSAIGDPDNAFGTEFNIIAVLQVIDIETGKVLVASASEGTYTPQPMIPLKLEPTRAVSGAQALSGAGEAQATDPGRATAAEGAEQGSSGLSAAPAGGSGQETEDQDTRFSRMMNNVRSKVSGTDRAPTKTVRRADGTKVEVEVEAESERFAIMRAADEMASGFADKFFARPQWDEVVMWNHPSWRYSEAARFVKLGQCPRAVDFMQEDASEELNEMSERDVSEYLHNYGVTLLCDNQPERAAEKLRSAYRIQPNQTTLNMLGLAGKIVEWSLSVEVDEQPEVEMLIKRNLTLRGR